MSFLSFSTNRSADPRSGGDRRKESESRVRERDRRDQISRARKEGRDLFLSLTLSRNDNVNLEPIGVVKSPVKEPTDENWRQVVAEIHLDDSLAPGIKGLDRLSHLILVFFMHQSSFAPATDLVRRPQERDDKPEAGIFASGIGGPLSPATDALCPALERA